MLVLPPELTHRQAHACQRQLRAAQAALPAGAVLVDAAALRRFDSSALAVLLGCRRDALAQGRAFAVRGLPDALAGLAQLYGVRKLLEPQG